MGINMNQQKFKDTEIGRIPKEWKVVKLDTIADIETGKRAKGGGLSKGSVASIGGEHIDQDGNILWDKMKFIPESFYEDLNQGKVRLGDILMVKDGATTGKTCIVRSLPYEKVAINEHVFLIKSKAGAINEFLFYVLFSKVGQNQIKLKFHGLIGGIKRGDIKSIIIPLPPLPQQQKIAEILSTVDSAIEKVNQAIDKTQRLKKGLMQELLTKGIGHKEFKDTEIGRIPKQWEVVDSSKIFKLASGKSRPSEISIIPTKNMPFPIYGGNGILGYTNKFMTDKETIVIGRVGEYCGSIHKAPKFSWITDNALYIVKLIWEVNLDFLKYLFIYVNLNKFKRKSGQPLMTQAIIYSLKLPLPPLSEQQKIAEILSTVDKKLELLKKKKEKLERIKKGLMNDLLTGKRRTKYG